MARSRRQSGLTRPYIAEALEELSSRDSRIAKAVAEHGLPTPRRRDGGFPSLARIVVGQQVSTHAAAAIAGRLESLLGGELDPGALLAASDEALRGVGLSRQKVSYLRALSVAVMEQQLPVSRLSRMSDIEVEERITAIKGFGQWSAHMYLMFSLGRRDIWPIGDLAVRVGFGRLMEMDERLTPNEVQRLAEPFVPHRSALALFCWHFYASTPDL